MAGGFKLLSGRLTYEAKVDFGGQGWNAHAQTDVERKDWGGPSSSWRLCVETRKGTFANVVNKEFIFLYSEI